MQNSDSLHATVRQPSPRRPSAGATALSGEAASVAGGGGGGVTNCFCGLGAEQAKSVNKTAIRTVVRNARDPGVCNPQQTRLFSLVAI